MTRLLFTCAYDGQPYCGWQSQRCGTSVQDTIETAMARILKQPLRVAASGRTDAGVHAYAQCFHADIPAACRMNPENWVAALNTHLPASIRIIRAESVPADFHARFDAIGKEYVYLISRAPVLTPFLHGRAWHIPQLFDAALLAEALHVYEGEHDFRRFAANRGTEPENPPADFYIRKIYSADLTHDGDMLRLCFRGNGFMYRMVRLMVGTAHQVARRRMSVDTLAAMLQNPQGEKTRYCAPAAGLYLNRVFYGSTAAGFSEHEGSEA